MAEGDFEDVVIRIVIQDQGQETRHPLRSALVLQGSGGSSKKCPWLVVFSS